MILVIIAFCYNSGRTLIHFYSGKSEEYELGFSKKIKSHVRETTDSSLVPVADSLCPEATPQFKVDENKSQQEDKQNGIVTENSNGKGQDNEQKSSRKSKIKYFLVSQV